MPLQSQRRVLVAVTGMSPQVVTETLWALMMQGELPNEIHLITTSHGRNRAIRDLLDPIDGHFHAFCRDFGLQQQIRFCEEDISVIRTPDGEPLADIRTPEDNSQAADTILRIIQGYCNDPDTQVHVSIAGGRKSMGFFAGYALSLFGRPQDRLSHVLVSDPFESNKDFFYPSPQAQTIIAADGSALDVRTARVMLADIPFVRLRLGDNQKSAQSETRFDEAVRRVQSELLPIVNLRFELDPPAVYCSGQKINLAPTPFVVYLWFAKRCISKTAPARPGAMEAKEILQLHAEIYPQRDGNRSRSANTIKNEEDVLPFIQEKRSLIHKALKKTLPRNLASYFFIHSSGRRLETVYSLTIKPDAIEVIQ